MTPAEKSNEPRLGRLITAALERVAWAEVKRTVLDRALDEAGMSRVPDVLEELTFFVSGPLYEHASRALGEEFAEALIAEMSPVLDQAWELDRAVVDETASLRPESAVRKRNRSAIRRLTDLDAPPSAVESMRDTDTDPVHDTDVVPPSSRRNTMPYLESVLSESGSRVLVAHAHDTRRRAIALALEDAGHSVVTAHDARVAAMLMSRVHPSIVVADVETVAPDFEPLGPALEGLFGDGAPVPVVLLSDHRRPSMPEAVQAVVDAESSADEVLAVVEHVRQGSVADQVENGPVTS